MCSGEAIRLCRHDRETLSRVLTRAVASYLHSDTSLRGFPGPVRRPAPARSVIVWRT